MFKLLIVDDEEWIRTGIAATIPWEKYDICVTGCAADGKEAVSMIQIEEPDIVITDIVMTQMGGVELAGWIQENHSRTKVIILSGYDEFSYAREAMRKGAFDYLLKPVEEKALVETVRGALGELEKERGKEQKAVRYETSLAGLKELFFMKLLDRRTTVPELCGNEQEYLTVPLDDKQYYTCAVWTFGEDKKEVMDMLESVVRGMVNQNSSNICCDTMVLQSHILVVAASDKDEGVRDTLLNLYRNPSGVPLLCREFGCCIGGTLPGLKGLKEGMRKLSGLVANTICLTDGSVILAEELLKEQMGYGAACRDCIDCFLEGFDATDLPEAEKRADQLVADIFSVAPRIGKRELGAVLYQAMSGCTACCERDHIDIIMPVTENNEAVSWVFGVEEKSEAGKGMKNFLKWLYDNISHGDHRTRNYLIRETIDYVHHNFTRDISAEDLAEHLHISKVYFSQLFSREMGNPFTKYLTSYRIDYAKKQLKETNNRIYEVAEQCGYSDVKYFMKVFKKLTGMSPQAYREKT